MALDVHYYLGTTIELTGTYRVAGVVTSLASHSLRATLKDSIDDADVDAVAQITTVDSDDGIITTESAGGVANAGYRLKFKPAATASVAAGTTLYLDVRVEQADGDEFVIDPPAGQVNMIHMVKPVTLTSP